MENATTHGLPKTLDDLLNNPGDNLTYQDYASDIREILAYNRTQHKDITVSYTHLQSRQRQ